MNSPKNTKRKIASDENEISLYIITTCSNIQVTRIKEVITVRIGCLDI